MPDVIESLDDLPESMAKIKFGAETMSLIETAIAVGWRLVITSVNSATLVPHGEKPGERGKRIHLSSRKPVPPKRMLAQIRRGGDPAKVARMDDIATRVVTGSGPAKINALTEWDAIERAEAEQSLVEIALPEYDEGKKEPVTKIEEEVYVLSERPALMHRSLTKRGGQSYPSKTTLERRYSDGRIEYVCAVPGCDEVSENRLAFRGPHYAKHVRNGEAPELDGSERDNVVEDPTYVEPAYSKKSSHNRRLAGLTNLLKGINLATISPEDLAEQIEAYLESTTTGGGAASLEPLTPEQMIERIRRMIDNGTYSEQEALIQEQSKQIEDLMAYSEKREEELRHEALLAQQEAARSKAHLDALRDLINDLGNKEET